MKREIMIVAGAVLFLFALLAAWQFVAGMRLISPVFFPAPLRIAEALYRQISTGTIWMPFAMTSGRMLLGWSLAILVGVTFGAVIGLSTTAADYLEGSLEFLRAMPASAVLPIFIMVMGLTNEMIIVVIAFGSLWPILLGSLYGFQNVEPRLLEVSHTLGFGAIATLLKVRLPNAVPDILSGARVSVGFALILSVVAEMLSSTPGLGNNVLLASRSFRSADLFAGIVLLGMLGAVSTGAIALLEQRLLRWRRDQATLV